MPDPFAFVGIFFAIFVVMFILVAASGVAIPAIIVSSLVKERAKESANDAAPRETIDALVVGKRTQVQGESSWTTYYVTFETPDGGRREFSMTGEQYGLLVEGDQGRLTFQGTRYQEFERRILSRE